MLSSKFSLPRRVGDLIVAHIARVLSDPTIEFMLYIMRFTPIAKRLYGVQLARELLAQQFKGQLGNLSTWHMQNS
jgi:hypothetical protein